MGENSHCRLEEFNEKWKIKILSTKCIRIEIGRIKLHGGL